MDINIKLWKLREKILFITSQCKSGLEHKNKLMNIDKFII